MPVALFSDRSKAESVRRRLAQEGMSPTISDGPRLAKLWFVPKGSAGVRVQVPAGEFEKAEQFLLDWDASSGALIHAIRCPECQSLRVDYPQYARHSLLTNLALRSLAQVGLLEKDYYCEDCHFTWPKEGTWPRRDRAHLAPFYFIEGVEQTTRADKSTRQKSQKEEHREAA